MFIPLYNRFSLTVGCLLTTEGSGARSYTPLSNSLSRYTYYYQDESPGPLTPLFVRKYGSTVSVARRETIWLLLVIPLRLSSQPPYRGSRCFVERYSLYNPSPGCTLLAYSLSLFATDAQGYLAYIPMTRLRHVLLFKLTAS